MSSNNKPQADVEMKDEAKKEETQKVEEPADKFYGKDNS